MMVYRIARRKYIHDLTGEGAKTTGGRWNPKGTSIVYASSTSSLAILEKLVHVDIDLLPADLFIAEILIDTKSTIQSVDNRELPRNWKSYPSSDKLKEIGYSWITKGESLVLCVPSVVNPLEQNMLINLHHAEMKSVKIKRIIPFVFDKRFI